MGIGPGYKYRGKSMPNTATQSYAGNPNPSRFEVLEVKKGGTYYASRVHYPDCTNFEGDKVLVTEFDPRQMKTLDPHFADGNGIIARFKPSTVGWKMALRFIEREG